MMGGGGSIQGMITALRNNKNLLSKRKSMYDKKSAQKTSGIKKGLNCNIEATEEQLLEIRLRIQKRNKRKKIINSLIITISVLFVLYFSFLNSKKEVLIKSSVIETKTDKDFYKDYIQYGDTWLEEKKWNAAIYNYQKAVNLYPENFDANYRLALAYAYSCVHVSKHCDSGNVLIKKLMISHGEKNDILYLEAILTNNQN